MTDEQIEKALEHCTSENYICIGCPYYSFHQCTEVMKMDALTLIRRQKQRITAQREELRRINKVLAGVRHSRDAWKAKAERVGKQLHEVLSEEQI